ncbi:BatA domain-containing protein [Candidatus Poribacteria bacterium]|nr:BatA domain-containing protein [Candidatus Poribacteria bacterium]
MAFLNPFFLFGLLATGIPLVIHLWNRRRVVTIDFSSLIFITAAHRENARRFQLRQFLILLLRMAVIALIALALARPFLTLGLPVASVRAKTDVIIVLDNSYSMAYQDINGIRFDKAKILATDIIDSLRHGDRAALILMSDIPKPIFRQLTPDIESVTEAINDTETSYRTTNVHPSLELAHEILAESEQLNKEIYLISDFAQNGWENWNRLPNRSGARIALIPVAKGEAHNISIKEIRPSNQLIGVDLPFQFNVTTVNHSVAPLNQNILTLFIGGEKQKTMSLSAAANESLNTALTYNFSTPGTHIGYLTLTDDRLNIDNRHYFAFDVLGEVRVLCVGEQTEYLTLALNPHTDGFRQQNSGQSSVVNRQLREDLVKSDSSLTDNRKLITDNYSNTMILPTQCTPDEFETFPLEDYDVIILADVGTISLRMSAQLQEFIRQGKSLIAFVSSHSDPTSYNLSQNAWLPAQLGNPLTWVPPQRVQAYEETHPIFDIFPSEGFSMQYAPQFYNGIALQPSSESNVIARFGDDTPFLVERSQGTSAVMLYNCGLLARLVPASPTTSARTATYTNDLLVNPYFLPMLQQSVLYATIASNNILTGRRHVGDTYTGYYPRSAGGKASIRLMTVGSQQEASGSLETDGFQRFPIAVLPIAEDGTLRFQDTELPGIYQVEVQTQNRIQRDFFAVNVDTTESDLTGIPLAQAAARVGAQTTADQEIEGTTVAADAYNVQRHGREIWGELLILVVCLMLFESFLSNRGPQPLQGRGEGTLTAGGV